VIKVPSHYRGISPTAYRVLFSVLLSRLIPYGDKIVGLHHCGFQHKCIRTVYQFSYRLQEGLSLREMLYNILIEFGIPMKLVKQVKICLNKTCSNVYIGKHLSHAFSIQNGLKQGDAFKKVRRDWNLIEHSFWSMLMMLIYWVKTNTIKNKNRTRQMIGWSRSKCR
jgi:hypothetical protein